MTRHLPPRQRARTQGSHGKHGLPGGWKSWVAENRTRARLLAVAAAVAVLALMGVTLQVTTGSPDGGLVTGRGPLAGVLSNDKGDDPDNDTAADRGDITVDLDADGEPDTRVDANGNGKIDSDDPTLKELTEQNRTVTDLIGADPKKTNTSESLLTPPGAKWWELATSVAPGLRLYQRPAPTANWYAVTAHTATRGGSGPAPATYSALHIGFASPEAAEAWLIEDAEAGGDQWRFPMLRGSILTFAPVTANPNDEPFPPAEAVTMKMRPKAATWNLHIGRGNSQQVADAVKHKDALASMYAHLGFTPDTMWHAVATNPAGPWTGKLTGYKADKVDLDGAAQAVASTVKNQCTSNGPCIEVDPGLREIIEYMAWRAKDGKAGVGINAAMLPKNAPKRAVLVYGYAPGNMAGVTNGTKFVNYGPIGYFQGWITRDLTMVRYTKHGAVSITADPNGDDE